MKHISIVASGTRGDVQPYVALGAGLRTAGYAVRVVSSDDFEALVTEAGLDFASTGIGLATRLQSDEWRTTTESGNVLKMLGRMRSEMTSAAAGIAQRMPGLLRGSDLIVGGMAGTTGAFSVAEKLKVPVVQAYVVPFTPTGELAAPLLPGLSLGSTLNRLSFGVMRQLFWQSGKMVDTHLRQSLGLPKQSWWGPYRALERSGGPVLYGYSPHVLPRPRDWPTNLHVTGYWFLDQPDEWTPPDEVHDFLAAGAPPVYIGFGSMGSRDPQATGRLAIEALERSGQRGILAAGWGGLGAAQVPSTVLQIGSLPHRWLFPRMAVVVHHGGAGTTAAGVRAGVPAIVVPFGVDQPFWGQRVAELGVGPAPLPRKKLTAERLAAAIGQAASDATMRRTAAALGAAIRAEDGIGDAVAIIDRFMERGSVQSAAASERRGSDR